MKDAHNKAAEHHVAVRSRSRQSRGMIEYRDGCRLLAHLGHQVAMMQREPVSVEAE